jgi:hypothetical protein
LSNNFKNDKKLILLEINELNFDLIYKYTNENPNKYKSFEYLLNFTLVKTNSENDYRKLEPWIQWSTIHNGYSFDEHSIYRLDDIKNSNIPQIFELIEKLNYRVGVISSINVVNRLDYPSYFIPDPWTNTNSDSSWFSKNISNCLSHLVNSNSNLKFSFNHFLILLIAIIYFARIKNYFCYLLMGIKSIRYHWCKSLFLDLLLNDIHVKLYKKNKTNFSTLFLNAAAHIQHHYFFNSKFIKNKIELKNPEWYIKENIDPFNDLILIYNKILEDYINPSFIKNNKLIIATGLTQKPYDRIKFYYKLADYKNFLRLLGVKFDNVYPRMSRDFLIEFKDDSDTLFAQRLLSNIYIKNDGLFLFGDIERNGNSLFLSLTYPNEINDKTVFIVNSIELSLINHVNFVAIKNGMHTQDGYAYFIGIEPIFTGNDNNIKNIFKDILNFFKL